VIDETMRRLSLLEGTWRGTGAGDYPTIDAFEYEETIRFDVDDSYPLIHYEQKTRLIPSGEASHWESGFIRPLDDGSVEWSSVQDSGRVEVLRGRLAAATGETRLVLDSIVLGHDPRLVSTQRTFTLRGDRLSYIVRMSTRTTPEPRLGRHLKAELERATHDRSR